VRPHARRQSNITELTKIGLSLFCLRKRNGCDFSVGPEIGKKVTGRSLPRNVRYKPELGSTRWPANAGAFTKGQPIAQLQRASVEGARAFNEVQTPMEKVA